MKRIPPFQLIPEPLNEEAARMPPFKLAPKPMGTRHQLGGKPDFIQNPFWPHCRSGHGKMTFYAQLDLINDDVCIADCGMIYVFICFKCSDTHSFVQYF